MIELTERAADQVKKAASDADMTGLVLRVAVQRKPDGSLEYAMGFDPMTDDDVHIKSHGVDVVAHPAYVEMLNGAKLDFVELEPGNFQFVFLNPNDPTYVPPNEG
jgi:iron-sulfur cluster assembly protein